MSEAQLFLSFLLEKWIIADRRRIFRKYEELSEEQLLNKVKDNVLQSLFLLKRQLDPGFRVQIYERIKEKLEVDKDFFKMLRKKVLSFTKTVQFFVNLKLVNSNRESWRKRFEIAINVLRNQYQMYPLKVASIVGNYTDKLNYFLDVMDNLQKHGHNDYILATETLIKEIMTGIDQSSECFTTLNPFKPSVTYEKYRLLSLKFMIDEINFEIIDHFNAQRNNFYLTNDFNLTLDLIGNPLLKKVEEFTELMEDSIEIPNNENIERDQYPIQPLGIINCDMLSILSLIYWNNLAHSKKIQLLNKFHGMKLLSSNICNNLKLLNIYDFHVLVDLLFKYHYFSECILLLEEYMANKNNELSADESNILHLSYIFILLRQNRMDEAEMKFRQHFSQITEIFPPNLGYYDNSITYEILYKWCEYLSRTNHSDLIKKIIVFLESDSKKKETIEQKRDLLILLSRIERLNKNFEKERHYLNEALTEIWLSNKKYKYLEDRIHEYEQVDFDYKEIEVFDKEKEFYTIIELALESQLMGDFPHSLQILEEISNQAEILDDNQKYKNKYFEVLIFCYFFTSKYEEALKILNICLRINPNDNYLRSYLYLINLKIRNLDIIKEIVDMEKLSEIFYFREFLRNSLNLLGHDAFKEFCYKLLSYYTKGDEIANCVLDVTNLLADLGFFSLSLEIYNYGLKHVESDFIKAQILNGIGTVYTNLNNSSKSVQFYQDAIHLNPNNKRFYENLSMAYQLIPDYSAAQNAIRKAIEISKKQNATDDEIKILSHKYLLIELHLIGFPNINKIQDKDTIKLFKHAFLLEQKVYKINSEIQEVANSIFNAYTNALDSLLHNRLAALLLDKIYAIYGPSFDQCSSSVKNNMDLAIKYLFQGHHLSLPQWKMLINNLRSENISSRLITFKDCLPPLKEEEYLILFETIDLLNKYRIPSVHGQITTFESYVKIKHEIMPNLNKIIDFL